MTSITEEHKTALFERPFRTQVSKMRHICAVSSGLKQPCLLFFEARVLEAGSGSHFADSSSHFDNSAAPGQARAATWSILQLWGRPERPFRAFCGSGASSSGRSPGETLKALSRLRTCEGLTGIGKHLFRYVWELRHKNCENL